MPGRAQVFIRTRPTTEFNSPVIDFLPDGKTVRLHREADPKQGVVNNQILDWQFSFDGILFNSSQEAVFKTAVEPLVDSCLSGFNCTLLCYGQVGSGKTYSLSGGLDRYENRGGLPRALTYLFKRIEAAHDSAISVSVSYYEIYNEQLHDLLRGVDLHNEHLLSAITINQNKDASEPVVADDENGNTYVRGMTQLRVSSEEEALHLLFEGEANRAIRSHPINKASSRSHTIFTIYVESRSRVYANSRFTQSQLNFVDLAGTERLSKTRTDGALEQETNMINKSLTFLEQAVLAISGNGKTHVPFRQTKLTHCLKPALVGLNKTVLIANVWPEPQFLEESVSTMRFAAKMMQITGDPVPQECQDPHVLIRELREEIGMLRRELAMHDTLTNRHQIQYEPLSEQQKFDIRKQVRQYLQNEIDEIEIINVRQLQGVFDALKSAYKQAQTDFETQLKVFQSEQLAAMHSEIGKSTEVSLKTEEDVDLTKVVGESDSHGFSVGVAKGVEVDQEGFMVAKRKERAAKKGGKVQSPTPTMAPSNMDASERDKLDKDPTTLGSISERTTLSTQFRQGMPPPTKKRSFEDFKSEQGSELQQVFRKNKSTLLQLKQEYLDLAAQQNQLKNAIDQSRHKVLILRGEREDNSEMIPAGLGGQRDSGLTTDVISEAEYAELKKLEEVKRQYKATFEGIYTIKSQIAFSEKLVNQTRQRLVEEFERWYYKMYIEGGNTSTQPEEQINTGGVKVPAFYINNAIEDAQEKQERLQREALIDQFGAESVVFQTAKNKVLHKKAYMNAVSQPQPSWHRKLPPLASVRSSHN